MPEFDSWRSYWNFETSVRNNQRYVRSKTSNKFLKTLLETSRDRELVIKKGSIWWRAQIGHDWRTVGQEKAVFEIPCAFHKDRMKPQPQKASDGRVNSRGIPCLYLASHEKTAISETRPWVGSNVSIAQFRILRPLKIIDFARGYDKMQFFFEEPDLEKRKEAVWYHIDQAFSKPTTIESTSSEYIPTQIISEYFKDAGFDGIGYKSSCCKEGFNLAIFNTDDANLLSCGLQKIKHINLEYDTEDQTYFIQD